MGSTFSLGSVFNLGSAFSLGVGPDCIKQSDHSVEYLFSLHIFVGVVIVALGVMKSRVLLVSRHHGYCFRVVGGGGCFVLSCFDLFGIVDGGGKYLHLCRADV